jgi:acyl dehydratase
MADRFLEDVSPGDVTVGAPIPVTEAMIVGFASQYDPQPFHTDPVAAAASPFGSLIASGWHIAALIMRQLVDMKPYGKTPLLGLGLDELRWLQPVRPGDSLTTRREVLSVRRSASKPDRGIVKTLTEVSNQDGVKVMTFTVLTQVPARTLG